MAASFGGSGSGAGGGAGGAGKTNTITQPSTILVNTSSQPQPKLYPPFRLNLVESCAPRHTLYRSGFPRPINFPFLQKLQLKTIISLAGKEILTDLSLFCSQHSIQHLIFPTSGGKSALDSANAPSPALIAQVVSLCIDPSHMPILVHCVEGAYVTGLVVGVLRKLQHWNFDSIYAEFALFTKTQTISDEEKLFLAKFRAPVTLPPTLTRWMWGGERPARHPTIPLLATAVSVPGSAVEEDDPLDDETDLATNSSSSTTFRERPSMRVLRHASSSIAAPVKPTQEILVMFGPPQSSSSSSMTDSGEAALLPKSIRSLGLEESVGGNPTASGTPTSSAGLGSSFNNKSSLPRRSISVGIMLSSSSSNRAVIRGSDGMG